MHSVNSPSPHTVSRILENARHRRNPADIPGYSAKTGASGKIGLTQEDVAHLAGVSRKWYAQLERGRPGNYSDHVLQAVRRALALNSSEWEVMYRIIKGHPPPVDFDHSATVPPKLRTLVETVQPYGAYLNDRRWDLLAYNEQFAQDFPWVHYGLNVMEWVLTWPDARRQLVNWETEWARPMVAQLRLHAEQWKSDRRLQQVVHVVRGDPAIDRLWDSDLPNLVYPSISSPRRLYLPRKGRREFVVTLLTMVPDALTDARFMTVMTEES